MFFEIFLEILDKLLAGAVGALLLAANLTFRRLFDILALNRHEDHVEAVSLCWVGFDSLE